MQSWHLFRSQAVEGELPLKRPLTSSNQIEARVESGVPAQVLARAPSALGSWPPSLLQLPSLLLSFTGQRILSDKSAPGTNPSKLVMVAAGEKVELLLSLAVRTDR